MAGQTHDPEEAYPGKDLGSRGFVTTDDMLGDYFDGLEIERSWYFDASPYDHPVAPSMTLASVDGGFGGAGFKNNFGNLWMRQQWDLNAPIMPDQEYQVTSKIVDVYEHRSRTVTNQEVTLWSPDGEVMAQGHHHQSYLLDQSSGRVQLRDPKTKGGARRFAVPEGDLIEGDPHPISLEMCGTFFHGNANYHTSKEAAEELGFSEVVVGGKMTLSLIGDMMDRNFGTGWFEGGSLDIKFANIVWPDDTVTAKAVVTDESSEGGKTSANLAVWMEKQDGTVVIVGTAHARV
jgi:hypothetical protein